MRREMRGMSIGRQRAVRRGVVALVGGLLAVLIAGPGTAHAAAQTMGTLKICKVLAAGTTAPEGTLFTFTVSRVSGVAEIISMAPGTCVPLEVAPGEVRVTETGSAGLTVVGITFVAGTGTTDVATGSTTATVVATLTTEVEFTNAQPTSPGGGGGTATPELGSGELVATGILPLGAVLLYRRRRARRATQQQQ